MIMYILFEIVEWIGPMQAIIKLIDHSAYITIPFIF